MPELLPRGARTCPTHDSSTHFRACGSGRVRRERDFVRLPTYVDRDDLRSAGLEGLVRPPGDFKSGSPFRHYAISRIRGAIMDDLRRNDWASRSVRQAGGPVSKPSIASWRHWVRTLPLTPLLTTWESASRSLTSRVVDAQCTFARRNPARNSSGERHSRVNDDGPRRSDS